MISGTSHTPLEKLTRFEQRLRNQLMQVDQLVIPADMAPAVTTAQLKQFYTWLLTCWDLFQPFLLKGINLRLKRDPEPGFFRSFQILWDIEHPQKDLVLILETKSKFSNGEKNLKAPKYEGALKEGKDSWRIDSNPIEPWISLLVKTDKELYLEIADKEVKFSQSLFKSTPDQPSDLALPFSYYLKGKPYKKVQIVNGKQVELTSVPLVSRRAQGTLADLLYGKKRQVLNALQICQIIQGLLTAVKLFHDKGLIHQDLRTENILCDQTATGFDIKLTDYNLSGRVDDPNLNCTGSVLHLSPQIALFYSEEPESLLYKYIFVENEKEYSFGVATARKMFYEDPTIVKKIRGNGRALASTANDIWSLGVIIVEIILRKVKGVFCAEEFAHLHHPLAKGFLQADPAVRMTLVEALALNQKRLVQELQNKALLDLLRPVKVLIVPKMPQASENAKNDDECGVVKKFEISKNP